MKDEKNNVSRKKFLTWGIALSSVMALPSLLWARKPRTPKGKMIKMLTPEGKLVEVDEAVLKAVTKREKAGNKEILNWMNNPSKKD